MRTILFAALVLVLTNSCTREIWKTVDYDSLAPRHRMIALLPVETVTSGRIPRNLAEADIIAIENAESRAFLTAVYSQLMRRSGGLEHNVKVRFQHYVETLDRLDKAGISPRESWYRSNQELAQLLGVDAVVRVSVQKQRYLTDLESFGVQMAANVAAAFGQSWALWAVPGAARTSDMFISGYVIDGASGATVWSTNLRRSTTWTNPSQVIIDDASRAIARRFPYRE